MEAMNVPILEPEAESDLAGISACGRETPKSLIFHLLSAVQLRTDSNFASS